MNSSAPAGLWDPQSQFNYASPLPRPPAPSTTSSTSVTSTPGLPRRAHVTSATPAKRITFYKSGDNQFGGIRMAIHGRSFKCFDALLDDLSQKVPLPFGVRTVTTPRGTRNIKHLEQLQDRGCYLCSDRRQAKPVNMELAGKRPVIWQYQGRRPWAPCMGPPPSHSALRQRRILLVKNSEPGLRRSTVLSRRNTRSLKAFLDEVSEVMQFHVRRLYTVEGRKIDSVQSLMTCPSVLVCAGREAFSATLLDCARKNSEEKLPGLGTRTPGNGARSPATLVSRSPPNGARSTPRVARSRASDGSDGSKKSVNFGLETKKSVIHRRSDSSNHSARFSVSSDTEKQGVGCPHQARTAFDNDDIEKRVLVNKDGSLSVEMKVRFRLHNEETVQWSTQIRKSPPASLSSDCYPLKEDQPCYLQQGQSESCSDPDSASASCDPGVADYISQSLRHPLEENHCPCCCQRCQQQYDLWENPAHSHKHPVAPPLHASRHTHSSSSSSSCRSRRVVRRHARLSDSGSEQGRVVQEEVCVIEEVQRKVEQSGDSCVEVCRISRCSSRSEVEVEGNLCPHSRKSVEDSGTVDGEERPLSAISNSSHVLQALQEDDDDEEEENLPSSASQCCSSREPAAQTHLIPRPPSKGSISSAHSAVHSKTPQCEEDGCKGNSADEMDRATSSRSQTSRTSHRSTIVRTLNPEEEGAADDEAEPRVLSSLSSLAGSAQSRSSSVCPDCGGCKRGSTPASCASQAGESCSRASHRSHHSHHSHHSHTATANPPASNEEAECVASGASDDSDGSVSSMGSNRSNLTHQDCFSALSNIPEGRPSSIMSHASNRSKHSPTPLGEPPAESAGPEEEERAQSTTSAASHRSRRSHKSICSEATAAPDADASGRGTEGEQEGENVAERAASAVSAKSNTSAGPEEEERAQSTTSAASHRSRRSHKSNCSEATAAPDAEASGRGTEGEQEGENVAERAASAVSAKSNASARTGVSAKSASARAVTPAANPADVEADTNDTKDEVRASSVLSTKSAKSDKSAASKVSRVSHKSCCSHCGKAVSPCPNGADNATGAEAMDRDEEQMREEEEVMDGRAASAMSAKSNLSAKSCKSHKSSKALARSHSPTSEAADDGAERAASAMTARSTKSNISVRSAKSCMSDYNGSSKEKVKEEVGEEAEEKSAIATSRKSSHSGGVSLNSETVGENGEGEEMEVGDKTDGGDENVERAASAISVKSARSNLSAKSSKSHKSTCKHIEIPTIETNGAEGGTDEVGETPDERVASAMSAKSKLSVKSSRSHKSDGNGGKQEGGEEKLEERSVSVMSAKSIKSNVSAAKSHQSGCDISPAEVPVIETTDADIEGKAVKERTPSSASTKSTSAVNAGPTGDGGSVRSKSVLSVASASARSPSPRKTPAPQPPSSREQSIPKAAAPSPSTPQTPKRQLLPGSEAGVRGSSALSVRSAASTRSNRSKCHCGASSALQKMEKEEEDELENKGEKATERAASVLSASLGIERPLSGASSGSVSLGLPEDREHESINSDDSRSHISSHTARSNLSATSSKVKPVDIPTIETTGGNEEAKEGEMPEVERSASALSAKSNASAKSSRSQKSTSIYCPAKTGNEKSTIYLNTPDNRTPSAMSSSSNKVRIKSPTRASPKPTTPAPGDSAVENLSTIKPSEGKEDMTDENAPSVSKSPNCLRPQSAAASSSGSDKKTLPKESLRPKSAVATDESNSNESTLSKSLSAADLLKETLAAGRPLSRQSKGSEKSGASRRSGKRKEADLTPACLPNASLNEVVSDWLKNIPTNGCMFALGDELNDGGQQGKETEGGHGEKVEKEVEEAEVEKVEEEEGTGDDVVEEEKSDAALPTADITSSHPAALFEGKDLLHKNCHSSVAVMKVLLSPIRGRCRSLPEVSPVYGRRLSTSAQGLLDCLAQLQLIEPGSGSDSEQPKDRNQRYCEIITLLQSLWLSKPKDKEAGQEQVSPPRSSSGVGMSSGSGGSGNNGIDGGDGTLLKTTDNEAVSTHVADAGEGETEAGDTGEEKPTVDEGTKGGEELTAKLPELPTEEVVDSPKSSEAPSPSDKSSNGDSSKSHKDTEQESPNDSNVDSPSAVLEVPLSKQPSQDPDPVWVLRLLKKLEKQFMNHYTDAMTEFKVRWDLDDSLMLNTMIKELREEVSQRIQRSIGRELKKIQSRAGKAPRPPTEAHLSRESTMTDRRRQMLKVMKNQSVKTADSLSDDETTGEYSDPRSDDDYCPCDACVKKKMEARPPKMHPAANAAPVMMAFDLRKILQLKKAPEPPPAANAAPVMMAFDLRTILERKKAPEPPPPPPPALSPEPADGNGVNGDVQEEGNNLEVVQEEDEDEEGEEETKDIIVPSVILEETIPEEDEEEEEEGVENAEEKGGERAEETCECQHPHETEGEGGEEEDENDDGEQEKEEEEEEEEAAREEQSEDAVENEEESAPEGNTGAEAEDEDEDDDGEGEKGTTDEDESGGETASTQRKEQGGVPVVCVMEGEEGEEADSEDSDMGSKRPSEAGADQSGCDGTAEDEVVKEAAGEGESEDVVENIVEEGKQVNGLFHQYTRTSVESQPGSMEAIDTEPSRTVSPLHLVKSQETGTKMVTGVSRGEGVAGKGQRRSRSPARVKRRKPKGSDSKFDDLEI